ncbi:hypothetical protein ACOMHN_007713 [Nucella lapillus]
MSENTSVNFNNDNSTKKTSDKKNIGFDDDKARNVETETSPPSSKTDEKGVELDAATTSVNKHNILTKDMDENVNESGDSCSASRSQTDASPSERMEVTHVRDVVSDIAAADSGESGKENQQEKLKMNIEMDETRSPHQSESVTGTPSYHSSPGKNSSEEKTGEKGVELDAATTSVNKHNILTEDMDENVNESGDSCSASRSQTDASPSERMEVTHVRDVVSDIAAADYGESGKENQQEKLKMNIEMDETPSPHQSESVTGTPSYHSSPGKNFSEEKTDEKGVELDAATTSVNKLNILTEDMDENVNESGDSCSASRSQTDASPSERMEVTHVRDVVSDIAAADSGESGKENQQEKLKMNIEMDETPSPHQSESVTGTPSYHSSPGKNSSEEKTEEENGREKTCAQEGSIKATSTPGEGGDGSAKADELNDSMCGKEKGKSDSENEENNDDGSVHMKVKKGPTEKEEEKKMNTGSGVSSPSAGKPVPGKPVPGKPVSGKPVPGKPVSGKPVPGKPVSGKPVPGKPVSGKPVPGKPVSGKPVPGKPVSGKPVPGKPVSGKPVPGKPVSGKPVPGKPVSGKPVPGKPVSGKPVPGKPVPGKPGKPVPGREKKESTKNWGAGGATGGFQKKKVAKKNKKEDCNLKSSSFLPARLAYVKRSWSEQDTQFYRDGYPGKPDNPELTENLDFYQGKIKCLPNGVFIDEVHEHWWNDFDLLEVHHGYIQWLFPIRETGMNYQAQELQLHEAEKIQADETAMMRFKKSYEMMLNFYGIRLNSHDTGEVERAPHWRDRFQHLNFSMHNYLRITRILKCLGELGLERFKAPFLRLMLHEALRTGRLGRTLDSCYNYWIGTVRDDEERQSIYSYAIMLAQEAEDTGESDVPDFRCSLD